VHALIAACRRARVCRQLAACRVGICCKQLSRLPPLPQLQQQPYPAGALFRLLFAASAAPTTATAALPCRCSFQIALSGFRRSHNCNSSPALPVLCWDCSSRLPPLPQVRLHLILWERRKPRCPSITMRKGHANSTRMTFDRSVSIPQSAYCATSFLIRTAQCTRFDCL